ncbi:MAG: hypothetical protein Q9191_003088 [Dirinaria sp. TL-2023a]
MTLKPGKPKSKRTPVRLRHKIEKASAAKQRKQRKLAKNNPQWRSRLKKDPGIPNLFPYKDKILQEIEEKRKLKEEETLRKREELKEKKAAATSDAHSNADGTKNIEDGESIFSDDGMDSELQESNNPMSALLASARARAAEYEDTVEEDEMMDEDDSDDDTDLHRDSAITFPTRAEPLNPDSSRRAYDKTFKSVLSSADIILYVLDARDPNATRSQEIEHQIEAADGGAKRLILILNKIDLVPPSALHKWLKYLRRFSPTLPLRASTAAPNARTFDHKALTPKFTSETLLRALKTYSQRKQLKRSTTVGIIGYPNVGKSSVINALTSRLSGATKRTACPVGAEAGITTALREVKLDNKLKLLDSPGIVFPNTDSPDKSSKRMSEAQLTLLSALPPKAISDPVPAITLLLSRLSSSQAQLSSLLTTYNIPPLVPSADGDITTDFLVQVARRRGRLGKGGVPNLESAAMAVLSDWRDGRIQGWVEAPSEESGQGDKEIVKEWAEEFKLEGLWGNDNDQELQPEDAMED